MKSNESASCDRVNSVSRGKLTRCQNLPRPLLPIPSLISNDGRLFPRSLKRKDTFVPFVLKSHIPSLKHLKRKTIDPHLYYTTCKSSLKLKNISGNQLFQILKTEVTRIFLRINLINNLD